MYHTIQDFDQYNVEWPSDDRPSKPKSLDRNATPDQYRKYADDLEVYNAKLEKWQKVRNDAQAKQNELREKFKNDLFESLGVQDHPKKEKLWSIVSDNGGGWSEMYYYAQELSELML